MEGSNAGRGLEGLGGSFVLVGGEDMARKDSAGTDASFVHYQPTHSSASMASQRASSTTSPHTEFTLLMPAYTRHVPPLSATPSTPSEDGPGSPPVLSTSQDPLTSSKRKRADTVTECTSEAFDPINSTTYHIFLLLVLPSVLVGTGRKVKVQKPEKLKRGPIEVMCSLDWNGFISAIAECIHARPELIDCSSMEWKPNIPANSQFMSLSSQAGYSYMVKSVIGRSAKSKIGTPFAITVQFSAPKTETWETSVSTSGSSQPAPSPQGQKRLLLRKGDVNGGIQDIMQELEEIYAIGKCPIHPKLPCAHHRPSGFHFDMTKPRLMAFAKLIDGDPHLYDKYTIPIGTPFFKKENRITKPGVPTSPTPSPVLPPPVTPLAPLHSYPTTSHSSDDEFHVRSSSPLLGDTISLEEFVDKYFLDKSVIPLLQKLGYTPGVSIKGLKGRTIKEAGFTPLSWKPVAKAANAYYKIAPRI